VYKALQLPEDFKFQKNELSNFERCFIFGNGPTLNKIDLSQFENELVIGVNGILHANFIPTFLCGSSEICFNDLDIDEIISLPSRLILASRAALKYKIPYEKIEKVCSLRYGTNFMELYRGAFDEVNVTESVIGDIAIPLVAYMGIKKIYLFGLDGYWSPLTLNGRHFYKDEFNQYERNYVYMHDRHQQACFARIDMLCRLEKIYIQNLTPGSAIISFVREDANVIFPNYVKRRTEKLIGKYIDFNGELLLCVGANCGKDDAYSFLNIKNGRFMRHYNGEVIFSNENLNPAKFKEDSSFYAEPSFSDDRRISLRSVNCPLTYVTKDVIGDSFHIKRFPQDFIADLSSFDVYTLMEMPRGNVRKTLDAASL